MIRKETLKRLVGLMEEFSLAELEVSNWFNRVRVVRVREETPSPAPEARSTPSEEKPPDRAEERGDGLHEIRSPMVGTFYSAPSPKTKPFAEVGDRVVKGQTLCIIEAMKVMNEIPSDRDGVVTKILMNDGDPVEYAQPILLLKAV